MINPHIFPIKGSLSRADAVLISESANMSQASIFEFGIGASTTFLLGSTYNQVLSFENEPRWMENVNRNLRHYEKHLTSTPRLCAIDYKANDIALKKYITTFTKTHYVDLVLIDCLSSQRARVMDIMFEELEVKGIILYHDCRRQQDQVILSKFVERHFDSIEEFKPSYRNSNMCLIRKGIGQDYENWNNTERFNNRVSPIKDDEFGVLP